MGFHGLEFQANITAWDGKENMSENANDPKTTPTSLEESIPFKKRNKSGARDAWFPPESKKSQISSELKT